MAEGKWIRIFGSRRRARRSGLVLQRAGTRSRTSQWRIMEAYQGVLESSPARKPAASTWMPRDGCGSMAQKMIIARLDRLPAPSLSVGLLTLDVNSCCARPQTPNSLTVSGSWPGRRRRRPRGLARAQMRRSRREAGTRRQLGGDRGVFGRARRAAPRRWRAHRAPRATRDGDIGPTIKAYRGAAHVTASHRIGIERCRNRDRGAGDNGVRGSDAHAGAASERPRHDRRFPNRTYHPPGAPQFGPLILNYPAACSRSGPFFVPYFLPQIFPESIFGTPPLRRSGPISVGKSLAATDFRREHGRWMRRSGTSTLGGRRKSCRVSAGADLRVRFYPKARSCKPSTIPMSIGIAEAE